jgi:hypothetical protein
MTVSKHYDGRVLRVLVLAMLNVAGSACGDSPAGPQDDSPFRHVEWHLQRVGGLPLPALVAEEFVDGLPTRTYADSGVIEIRPDGSWQERVYHRTWRTREVVHAASTVDEGTWWATADGYRFRSTVTGDSTLAVSIAADSIVLRRPLGSDGAVSFTASFRPSRPAPGLVAVWRATHVKGNALPAASYVFDPAPVDGGWASSHFIVDSARISIQPTGEYVHRIHASEWVGPVGGGPTQLRARYRLDDHGQWQRTGSSLSLESGYLQNHRMTGSFTDGVLRLDHGLTHGDEAVEFRYGDRR